MFKTRREITNMYSRESRYSSYWDGEITKDGSFHVLVIKNTSGGYDVWNIHPLRKGWQLVYTLQHCDPEKQVQESLESLKRLFET